MTGGASISWLPRPIQRVSLSVAWWVRQFLLGKVKLAVPAYMVERPGHVDSSGDEMTRQWLFQQWTRIAQAGDVVRVVVVEGSVRGLSPGWVTYQSWVNALTACRSAGQLVYGYVAAHSGTRPPADVQAEVQEWIGNVHSVAPLDGIYLDEGPTVCAPQVAANYRAYGQTIRNAGLGLAMNASQWPDNAKNAAGSPDPWVRGLNPDFVQLWEEGVNAYHNAYGALDYCTTQSVIAAPPWWTSVLSSEGFGPIYPLQLGTRRIHAINDCADSATMRQLIPEMVDKGSRSVWVTNARQDPQLGSVYDDLPVYWDDMVAFVANTPL